MHVLIDTNILLRSVQRSHPSCRPARLALRSLYRAGHTLCITQQNVAEFWNVCTRPQDVNGMGLSIENTDRHTSRLERFFTILPDSIQAFQIWRKLVVAHAVKGVKVHDARLVSVMKAYGIAKIVTFNTGDFIRFSGIEAVHPEKIV